MSKQSYSGFLFKLEMAAAVILWLCLSACNPVRRLTATEQLWLEPQIEFDSLSVITGKKRLKEKLLTEVRPQPNSAFKLWVYNLFGEPKKAKGLKHWFKYKVGEPPVLYQPELAERSRLVLQKELEDIGYLNAEVLLDTIDQGQKVKAIYQVSAPKRYRLDSIYLPVDTSALARLTRQHNDKTLLKPGGHYSVQDLKAERNRLATLATQNGYYGLSSNDIYYYVDTTGSVDSLDLYLRWKFALDSNRLERHYLGNTTIYPTYALDQPEERSYDTIRYQDLTLIENYFFVKESLLKRAIRGEKNDLYDGRLQNSTISYLQNLDIFKFINLQNRPSTLNGRPVVNRTFYLTPAQVRDFRVDFETNTRSGSYFGILTSANYTNRNWLGGAERLDIGLSVGAETQPGGVSQFINTFEVTAQASLSFPRLLVPFKTDAIYQDYVARTRFKLSNAYQVRAGFFSINRLATEMTYDWRGNRLVQFQFSPVWVSLNETFRIDPEFQQQLSANRRLEESLKNVFILGGQYRMTYSTQNLEEQTPYFFFTGNLRLAGNVPYAAASLLSSGNEPYRFLGTRFSQFAKITLDARYYWPRRKHSWAFRFDAGLAVPYGNSTIVPYAEQFFIGGSTSLRAFRLRQLGPGAFVNPAVEDLNFFDQTGDVKLELNAEYRFDLATYFKGAFFVDAGNIWLLNETIGEAEEGRFELDSFLNEIAVGTGLGLRLDVNFFVIRLDGAFPLRKPVFGEGFEWTFADIAPFSRNWRSENLVWHLAIGYPF